MGGAKNRAPIKQQKVNAEAAWCTKFSPLGMVELGEDVVLGILVREHRRAVGTVARRSVDD